MWNEIQYCFDNILFSTLKRFEIQLALDWSLPGEKAIYEQGPELCIEKSYNLHDMENV